MARGAQQKIGSGFVAKSEPEQILAGKNLTGKVAVVTGGYSGIGLETTRALAARGVRVYVPVRSIEKAQQALADIDGDVVADAMDLSDLASVRAYGEAIAGRESKLDYLINNAGIMAPPETRLGKQWESQFAVNHLGHFVLTTTLLPNLLRAERARVVCLTSIGHRRSDIRWEDIHFLNEPYEKWTAYGQAKTANALFALGLDMRYGAQGLQAFSVHPGGILTPLQRHLPKEEMVAMGWLDANGELSELASKMFKSPSQGCTTTLWAATSEQLDALGGQYCEDCDVANVATAESPRFCDVAAWATSEESAERLWQVTEAMLAR
jgi:NAD(P)-dependent dehydrogenase (short-subunit alcohol dehydrogenase family)